MAVRNGAEAAAESASCDKNFSVADVVPSLEGVLHLFEMFFARTV